MPVSLKTRQSGDHEKIFPQSLILQKSILTHAIRHKKNLVPKTLCLKNLKTMHRQK